MGILLVAVAAGIAIGAGGVFLWLAWTFRDGLWRP
jgi:hypothetical protein